jgi:hypothetical protein
MTVCVPGASIRPLETLYIVTSFQRFRWSEWWGGWGSNPRPADYESAALTG